MSASEPQGALISIHFPERVALYTIRTTSPAGSVLNFAPGAVRMRMCCDFHQDEHCSGKDQPIVPAMLAGWLKIFLPGPITKGVDYGTHKSSPCNCGERSFLQGRCWRWNAVVGNRSGVTQRREAATKVASGAESPIYSSPPFGRAEARPSEGTKILCAAGRIGTRAVQIVCLLVQFS